MAGLYQIENPIHRANDAMSKAAGTYGNIPRSGLGVPDKTIGGGMQSAMGGGLMGATLAGAMEGGLSGNPMVAAGGAILGFASYFLS
jgi:hypothetical protein